MQTNLINICVLGEKEVGKTVYSKTLCNKEFKSNTKIQPTITDTYYSLCQNYKKKIFKINFIDTVGSDFVYEDTISKCTAFIIMFSYNNIESFNNIPMYLRMIKRTNKIDCPIIIVGNKYNFSGPELPFKIKDLKSNGFPYICIDSFSDYKQVYESFELLLKSWEKKYEIKEPVSIQIYQSINQSKNKFTSFLKKYII
ncbi:hypothetical protein DICPUDRAFT_82710 [Dictyostelium purpureum]|uniref:Uncharacterized protein n=1 Tax=Dictyostelium purpureum TaxID=5786 RepID=F0ZXC4_DICPU|nr:uncharacterized protein DICPUDRAFT_82710 [Dictyostelium purpureum]EGC31398.1 hypothetical protein DICPUDRAFT_82710 [Dictyostelium purpureum]|eukprot:XP_003292068.1 hypothetical protein DICPUDRAFT_82710 [Dictyostelium purpureum]